MDLLLTHRWIDIIEGADVTAHISSKALSQLIKRLIPAFLCLFAHFASWHTAMLQSHPGFTTDVLEYHFHYHLQGHIADHPIVGCRDHISVFIRKGIGVNDAIWFADLRDCSGTPIVLAIGPAHTH